MSDNWHVGREIPISVILAIVIQTCGLVWWASDASRRLETLESASNNNHSERIAVLEAETRTTRELLRNISIKLDRLIETKVKQ